HGNLVRRHLTFRHGRVGVALPHLHLALVGEHDLAVLVAPDGLDVHDAAVALARRRLYAEDRRLGLDRVAHAHRRAEAHVDVLEVGAPVLGDVLHALAEDDVHHQAGRGDQTAEPVGPGVATVTGEGVGRGAEIGG